MRLLRRPRPEHVTFIYRKAALVAKVAWRLLVMFGGIWVFAELADEIHEREVIPFDDPILRWLRARRLPALTRIMSLLTELGATRVLIPVAVLAGLWLWLRGNKRAGIYIWVSGAGAGLMNQALKLFFARARPEELLQLSTASGFAFPSGHSMGAAAVYGALAIVAYTRFPEIKWRIILACSVLVFGVGLSRVYLGVHYPSDVLAGWALGITWPLWLKHPLLTRPWNGLWRGRKGRRGSTSPGGAETAE